MRDVLSCLCVLTLAFAAILLRAQNASQAPPGIAWQVRGSWHLEGNGAPILAANAIPPGSLLRTGEGANHSITVLLPDGQRVLYECFTVEDCARGFRVPSLYRRPDPFAVDMLARIRAVLVRENPDVSSIRQEPRLPRDEVVAVLGSGNRVHIASLAAHLANGRYSYNLQSLNRAYPRQFHRLLEKGGPFIDLVLPSSGLYVLTITDDRNTPRIDLLVAAIPAAQAANLQQSFRNAKALLTEWEGDYYGWPVHDFQRAYLESLMLDSKSLGNGRQVDTAGEIVSNAGARNRDTATIVHLQQNETRAVDVTAEPTFFPKPGLFEADTPVALRCNTPGAILHYTVDGSQPVASSPRYDAPIMVKGTALTVKSFASATGRKDSAVVTGIFRIQQ